MVKILVTGFEPFGGDDENPTSIMANGIDGRVINGAEIVGRVLPVSYAKAKSLLMDLLHSIKPDVYVGLGLAPGSTGVAVEKVALNIARGRDNDGNDMDDEPIIKDGPAAYFSTLPVKPLIDALRGAGIPARESYHAGTYLCNYVMYIGLHVATVEGTPKVAGFMHFPYHSEYISKRGVASPSLPLPVMFNSLIRMAEVVLEKLVGNPYKANQ
ncbi:pyrrolidone-carboxylate peptidase [Thermocladium modestius]|uniref:Pyrrolidone-carboxylate peptidase n=1 Tax=Thermocladium modestius TaxID=62609 RepID=A0A830GXY5_9CREN|nr:pyroglutamyl-peptidase I [Thermocladium modestius]GGP21973.1 pyrrolidone-carboxylate peptidase [Thermocladium modestius]